MDYSTLVANQRAYFHTGQTKDISFRIAQLKKLRQVLESMERELYRAIHDDFRKSEFETYGSELSFVYHAIDTSIVKVRSWAKRKRVKTNIVNFPARSYIIPEPLGVSLVIGAWNYPIMLSLAPMVASMAAGNTTIVKPSEFPAATSAVIAKLINSHFDPAYLQVTEGGVPETTALLTQRFDKLFFTGSTKVGRIVYEAAARHLTPATLELGGKSPAIVTHNANVREAARRISWGKFLNAGQTCIAPDYVLIHESLLDEFLRLLVSFIEQFDYDIGNANYVQIINERNFDRLANLLEGKHIYYGGKLDKDKRYISPTIVTGSTFSDDIMEEEIFGPILPVLTFADLDKMIAQLQVLEKPLALYLFTNDKRIRNAVLNALSFGGGAVNDTLMHFSNPHLPYGGVGASGMGSYHNEEGFKAFSHYKGIQEKPLWFETTLKYPPYTKRKFRWLKFLLSK